MTSIWLDVPTVISPILTQWEVLGGTVVNANGDIHLIADLVEGHQHSVRTEDANQFEEMQCCHSLIFVPSKQMLTLIGGHFMDHHVWTRKRRESNPIFIVHRMC